MIKNIIFDFDGVLVDSEILARKAFSRYLTSKNFDFSEQDFSTSYSGNKLVEVISKLSTRFGIIDKEIFSNEVMELSKSIYLKELRAVKGVNKFLDSIDEKKLIGSNRDRQSLIQGLKIAKLKNYFEEDGLGNIMLQNLDRFVVHANLNFFEKKNVQILGEVNIPGSYPLISDNETLESLLKRAGDLTSKALSSGIAIYRDKKYFELTNQGLMGGNTTENTTPPPPNQIDENASKVRVAWQNESITLMPGDSVVVKETTQTVNVSGNVYNPGLIEYRPGRSLQYYLNSAGGVTDRGNKKGIIVVYASGVVNPKKWYSTPKIEDGATIIVNAKELREPFDLTQFATNWTTIITSMITAIVLSQQVAS